LCSEYFAADDIKKVIDCLEYANKEHTELFVLGGGSNILFTQNFNGIVLHPVLKGIELVKEDSDYVYIKAYAGENWDDFVAYTVYKGWQGLENLSLIPGNVGASPIQNIGAYGVEVKDLITEVEYIQVADGVLRTLKNRDCLFGYRDSIFKKELKGKFVMISAVFRLNKNAVFKLDYGALKDEVNKRGDIIIKNVRESVIAIRESKLPDHKDLGNAGSFFKNPVVDSETYHRIKKQHPDLPEYPSGESFKIPAAWLIQKSGLKGVRSGNVGTHINQPLVIVNYGNATGTDIKLFSEHIQNTVYDMFGIQLQTEVNFI
jgi:UDP-N-acetylmuramate dehydrogenase